MDKQYIPGEIRRSAEANGGAPLGRQLFFQASRYKSTDWEGRFWVRWSDAVREAGFEPNRMNTAYDSQLLLDTFIDLMRELGRFPVKTELLLKARNDSSFPSHNTFSRFGSKQQLVGVILAYCKDRAGFDDVVTLCAGVANSPTTVSDGDIESEEIFGFVYLIRSGRYYKSNRSGPPHEGSASGRRSTRSSPEPNTSAAGIIGY